MLSGLLAASYAKYMDLAWAESEAQGLWHL